MSSSAEYRGHRRVLRDGHTGELSPARLVAARGSVVIPTPGAEPRAVEEQGPTVEERIAAAKEAAFAEGHAAGLDDARLDVERRRTETLRAMAASLAAASLAAARDRRAVVDEVVTEAVDLAFELLEVLVGDELAHRDSPVRTAIARAIALAPDGEDLRVRLHPGSELSATELGALASAGNISVLTDPSVEPTGCVVEAGACRIDAQIGPALDRVRAVLEQLRAHHDAVPDHALPADPLAGGTLPSGPLPGDGGGLA